MCSKKLKKAPISSSDPSVVPVGEVHFNLSGPLSASQGGSIYAAHFLDPRTKMTEVYPISRKSDLPQIIKKYINIVENHNSDNRHRIRFLRCDRAKENYPEEIRNFGNDKGIEVKFSPAYAPESNGAAERLVQEHWTRARVLLHGTDLPFKLWGEALHHANWLRNRVPSAGTGGLIPISHWTNLPASILTNC